MTTGNHVADGIFDSEYFKESAEISTLYGGDCFDCRLQGLRDYLKQPESGINWAKASFIEEFKPLLDELLRRGEIELIRKTGKELFYKLINQ